MRNNFQKPLVITDRPESWGKNNYADSVAALQASVATPGGMCHIDVCHDDWCMIYEGKHCNCEPDYVIRDDAGNVTHDAKACRKILKAAKRQESNH